MEMYIVVIYVIVSIVTVMATIMMMRLERRHGLLCMDVHKIERPFIPCIGGFGIAIGFLLGIMLLYALNMVSAIEVLTLGGSIFLSLLIGVVDDLNSLKSKEKILLGLLPALPIVIAELYLPRPWLPFLGHARLTIVYPLLILLAFSIYQNGANMLDTHNGTLLIFALSIHIFAVLLKLHTSFQMSSLNIVLVFIVVLASYLPFNIYPAKIFNGNTGSFIVGASLAISAIILRAEIYYILASMPMFINGFYYISSVKGFLQKEEVKRPVHIDSRGCIHPSTGSRIPLTLVRITVALSKATLSEKELVAILYTVFILTSLTSYIITVMLGFS